MSSRFSFRLPPGVARFWRGCRVEEKIVLGLSALVVPFCLGIEYSNNRIKPPLPPLFHAAPSATKVRSAAETARGKSGFLLVHVVGKVKYPGLKKLPAGARVFQALEMAGGATNLAATNALNLAAPLHDGEKIVVGLPVQTSSVALTTAATAKDSMTKTDVSSSIPARDSTSKPRQISKKALPATPLNLNTASMVELQQLPGVGPAIAARIVAAREQKRFSSLSDLDNVSGIGPKKLEAMRPYVTF